MDAFMALASSRCDHLGPRPFHQVPFLSELVLADISVFRSGSNQGSRGNAAKPISPPLLSNYHPSLPAFAYLLLHTVLFSWTLLKFGFSLVTRNYEQLATVGHHQGGDFTTLNIANGPEVKLFQSTWYASYFCHMEFLFFVYFPHERHPKTFESNHITKISTFHLHKSWFRPSSNHI